MNKRHVSYSFLMASLTFSSLSFSMHRALFMGAKAIGIGTLPAYGLYKSHSKYSEYKHFHTEIEKTGNITQSLPKRLLPDFYKDGIERPIAPIVEEFVRKRMIELNIPDAESLAIGTFYCDEIMVMYDKAVLIGEPLAISLEIALKAEEPFSLLSKNREDKIIENLQKTREALADLDSSYNNKNVSSEDFHRIQKGLVSIEKELLSLLDEEHSSHETRIKSINETIDESHAFLSHEAGHIMSKDHLNGVYASAMIPFAVQGIWSTVGCGLKKVFPIYGPLTLKKAITHSVGGIGSVVPKLGIAYVANAFYRTQREKAADDFGYKNSNRQQLELMRNIHLEGAPYFDEAFYFSPKKEFSQFDKLLRCSVAAVATHHPHPMDRAQRAQKYIDRCDAQDPEDKQ